MIVNTVFVKEFSNKPYLAYENDINEWVLVLKSTRDNRKIKTFMKKAKERIYLEYPNAKILFKVISYKKLGGRKVENKS